MDLSLLALPAPPAAGGAATEAQLRRDLAAAQLRVMALEEQTHAASGQSAEGALRLRIAELQTECQSLRAAQRTLESDLAVARAELREAQQLATDQEAWIAALRAEVEATQMGADRRLQALRSDAAQAGRLAAAEEVAERLRVACAAAAEERDEARARAEAFAAANADLERECSAARDRAAELAKRLADQSAELHQAKRAAVAAAASPPPQPVSAPPPFAEPAPASPPRTPPRERELEEAVRALQQQAREAQLRLEQSVQSHEADISSRERSWAAEIASLRSDALGCASALRDALHLSEARSQRRDDLLSDFHGALAGAEHAAREARQRCAELEEELLQREEELRDCQEELEMARQAHEDELRQHLGLAAGDIAPEEGEEEEEDRDLAEYERDEEAATADAAAVAQAMASEVQSVESEEDDDSGDLHGFRIGGEIDARRGTVPIGLGLPVPSGSEQVSRASSMQHRQSSRGPSPAPAQRSSSRIGRFTFPTGRDVATSPVGLRSFAAVGTSPLLQRHGSQLSRASRASRASSRPGVGCDPMTPGSPVPSLKAPPAFQGKAPVRSLTPLAPRPRPAPGVRSLSPFAAAAAARPSLRKERTLEFARPRQLSDMAALLTSEPPSPPAFKRTTSLGQHSIAPPVSPPPPQKVSQAVSPFARAMSSRSMRSCGIQGSPFLQRAESLRPPRSPGPERLDKGIGPRTPSAFSLGPGRDGKTTQRSARSPRSPVPGAAARQAEAPRTPLAAPRSPLAVARSPSAVSLRSTGRAASAAGRSAAGRASTGWRDPERERRIADLSEAHNRELAALRQSDAQLQELAPRHEQLCQEHDQLRMECAALAQRADDAERELASLRQAGRQLIGRTGQWDDVDESPAAALSAAAAQVEGVRQALADAALHLPERAALFRDRIDAAAAAQEARLRRVLARAGGALRKLAAVRGKLLADNASLQAALERAEGDADAQHRRAVDMQGENLRLDFARQQSSDEAEQGREEVRRLTAELAAMRLALEGERAAGQARGEELRRLRGDQIRRQAECDAAEGGASRAAAAQAAAAAAAEAAAAVEAQLRRATAAVAAGLDGLRHYVGECAWGSRAVDLSDSLISGLVACAARCEDLLRGARLAAPPGLPGGAIGGGDAAAMVHKLHGLADAIRAHREERDAAFGQLLRGLAELDASVGRQLRAAAHECRRACGLPPEVIGSPRHDAGSVLAVASPLLARPEAAVSPPRGTGVQLQLDRRLF
eukprot:TRINITY_DN1628_c7_g1_i3.p1 TRINITY_DN1628_c7_g1~~TRINITY_DN1628_c7_g1_i3.p1  ORF type:complete len:1237 (+),score=402.12 TRINITY_DN1628_c7_g1_i3:80-3790(+)